MKVSSRSAARGFFASGGRVRARLAVIAALGLILGLLGTPPAFAATANGAVFTGGSGTASVGGVLYSTQSGALTLTVTTSSDTRCVAVDGAHKDSQTSANAKTSWTFTFTAGAGDGARAVTATASPSFNPQSKCTGQSSGAQASYILDNTGPVVTAALAPPANGAGWNKADVGITWSASDSGVGMTSAPTPATDGVNAETGGITRTATASDRLGNAGNGSVIVKLDKTVPSINATRSPAPNGSDWNNTNVTVAVACGDTLSGIKSCTGGGTVILSTEGTNQSVSGTAVDNADNPNTATVTGINIDKTAPTLSGAPTAQPNAAGWYRDDVTIGWSASDGLSGLSGPVPSPGTISGEGTGLTAGATVGDRAGNTRNATSPAVKIDRTPPTTAISGTSNTWTNGSVTVTFTPGDNLSGVASTSYAVDGGPAESGTSFTLTTEGEHTVVFHSTDVAGNPEVAQTAQVKIDKTAPTIGHTFTPSGYTDGAWTNAHVTVTFACDDAASGVGSCSSPVALSAEGQSQQVVGIATDNAGNSATDTAVVSIDTTPPNISAAADREPNGAQWYRDDVTVSFQASDTLSGIAGTPAARTLTEGENQTAAGTATDAAGNSASAEVTGINIDKTDPLLTATFAAGWHTGDVTVVWSCTDPLSGVVSPPDDDVVVGEGNNLSSTGSCTDIAGNTTTKTVDGIKIDRTAPTTSASVPAPLAGGWYAGDVAVTLTGLDALSGIGDTYYRVDEGEVMTYDGAFDFALRGEHTITFWSTDAAGNTEAQVNQISLKIDGAPPVTTVINPISPDSGWFVTSGIPVAFSAYDGESGIAGTYYSIDDGDALLYGDPFTENLSNGTHTITYWSVDLANNEEAHRTTSIHIDTIAPTITSTASPAANEFGWNNADVTVTFTATDNADGSGVDLDSLTGPQTVATETAGEVITGSATDTAGNVGTHTVTVKLDKTDPGIEAAILGGAQGAGGWYTGPVTVGFDCSDELSGVATCPDAVTITADGAENSASGTTSDHAGNTASATMSGIKIDQEAPEITNVNVAGGTYVLGTVPAATCAATDTLSGLSGSCAVTVAGGTANGVGAFTWTATATDAAGNIATTSGTYKVIYRFDGFLQPINDTAHQVGVSTSVFKGGSTIPVKFQLKKADGTPVLPNTVPVWLTPVKGAVMSMPVDETVYAITADTGLSFRADGSQYIYNWKTPTGGNYYGIGVRLDDGQVYYVSIGLRK